MNLRGSLHTNSNSSYTFQKVWNILAFISWSYITFKSFLKHLNKIDSEIKQHMWWLYLQVQNIRNSTLFYNHEEAKASYQLAAFVS